MMLSKFSSTGGSEALLEFVDKTVIAPFSMQNHDRGTARPVFMPVEDLSDHCHNVAFLTRITAAIEVPIRVNNAVDQFE